MSELIERNRQWIVKSKYGTWAFNNKQSAEQLTKTLTGYEELEKTLQEGVKN